MNTNINRLEARAVRQSFGGLEVLSGIDLQVARGEIHAVIGPNGAGKSTLFAILSGERTPTSGAVLLDGRDITGISPRLLPELGVARNFQVPRVFNGLTVAENLTVALEAADRWCQGPRRDRTWVGPPSRWVREQAEQKLDLLSIGRLIDLPVAELSHGDRKMVELAMTLSQDPDLLLLDEPMAGMSPDEVVGCADVLADLHQQLGLTIVLVEHDMETVFRLASTVSVLAGGSVIASGDPNTVRSDAAVREAYLGRRAS